MRRATTVEPPGEEKRGERRRGLGKRVCASKSSQYLCNRIVSPYEESLLGKQGEKKKIRRGERKRAVPKGGEGERNGSCQGGRGCERRGGGA